MLISFAGMCVGSPLWIWSSPTSFHLPSSFCRGCLGFFNLRCFLLIEISLSPTSLLLLLLSIVGGELQPSLSISQGKLVCFPLMISDTGPLPFSYVILKLQNVACSVPAKCPIQSPGFHCHLDHLVSQLLPTIHGVTQAETAAGGCSHIWTERGSIPVQRSATHLEVPAVNVLMDLESMWERSVVFLWHK